MTDQALRYKITADDSDARKVLAGFANKLEQTQKKASGSNLLKQAGAKVEEFGANIPVQGVEKLGAALSATGPIAAGILVFAGLAAAAKQTVGVIDDLDEAAQGVGTTAVALADLRIGAAQAGVDSEQLTRALGALNLKAAEAAAGNTEAGAAFKRLGVDVKDSAGNLKTTERLLGELADATKGFANDAKRAQALADVFGQKLGPRLAAYLAQGSEALRVNSGLTQEQVEAATKAQREIDKTAASWERLKLGIGGAAASAINAFAELPRASGIDAEGYTKSLRTAIQVTRFEIEKLESQQRGPSLFERLFGGSPEEQLAKARAALQQLEAQLANLGTDRILAGRAAILAAERGPDLPSIGGKENAQAIESFAKSLQEAKAAADGATNIDRVLRAIANKDFGDITDENRKKLLGLAGALDKVQEFNQQRDIFTGLVKGLESELDATEKLTAVQRAQQFIERNPRATAIQQQREAILLTAQRIDEQKRLNDLLKEQADIDRQAMSIDTPEQRDQALIAELTALAGINEEMRKIRLTGKLEDLLRINPDTFSPEQLDRVVKGIAGIGDEVARVSDEFARMGDAGGRALEDLILSGGRDASAIFKRFGDDIARIAIEQNLTNPIREFFRTLDQGRASGGSWLTELLAAIRGFGGGSPGIGADGPQQGFSGDIGTGLGGDGLAGGASAGRVKASSAGTVVQISIDARGSSDPAAIARAGQALRAQVKADYDNVRARNPAYAR